MKLSPESLQSSRSDQRDERNNLSEATHIPGQGICYPVNDLGLHPVIPMRATSNVALKSVSHNLPVAHSSIPSDFDMSLAEADENLKTFLTYNLKRFPFLDLPGSVSSQGLCQERPFLWFCIMAVSSKSLVQQVTLGREVRTILGRQVLLEGKKI